MQYDNYILFYGLILDYSRERDYNNSVYGREKDYISTRRVNMGYVDIHSHVLPYMDDGSQDMETTMDMLRIAEAEGISDIIVTPHYKSGRFKGDSAQMHKLLESVRERIYEAEMQINLYPGNEIFYRSELEERLETGELSTMNRSSYVLVEFSPMEDFLYIRNAMEDIFSMGYIPILAHLERYQCMHMKQERLRELKNKGC